MQLKVINNWGFPSIMILGANEESFTISNKEFTLTVPKSEYIKLEKAIISLTKNKSVDLVLNKYQCRLQKSYNSARNIVLTVVVDSKQDNLVVFIIDHAILIASRSLSATIAINGYLKDQTINEINNIHNFIQSETLAKEFKNILSEIII
ncbi:hypothetical protein MODO_3114 [Myroides odoratimimus]|uniref:hypothetical protein n=1 Tax=Myroides odoratimimus TaxID=76832 RepID=UPI000725E951|nr:hypothetical protein [Myroides odoratimimus]GAQ15418.1 hypothetical protein MODO_3114 [Myroides odoratimimus]STZ48117.1 Uncharacterised protein [Myroides odoratimimus]